ncbi:MAG: DUF898 domain-containing protein [Rhodomicrobium sp.]|nr:DUF898 domain-containing protein [Rhodomicrobium sp.]
MSDLVLEPRTQQAKGTPISVSWAGNPWSLTGLCILNILLIIVTVGIYWFWARAEYRRYMWQMVRVNNEPLEYTGTGMELFIGYLKLFFFVLLPIIALIVAGQLALGPEHPAIVGGIALIYIGVFYLYFVGIFRAHRYILSRTRWRGIAFGLGGNAAAYAWTSIWSGFLIGFTLGWLLPWRMTALRRRLTSAMRFGSVPFRFEGGSGPLYVPFAAVWLCAIALYGAFIAGYVSVLTTVLEQGMQPTDPKLPLTVLQNLPQITVWLVLAAILALMIIGSWFEARKLTVFARATKIGPLDAELQASGGSVFWLTLSNLLILVLSLGILRPVTQARRLRYLVTRFALLGTADLDDVLRGAEQQSIQGAGLEAAFSIEIF